MMDNLIKILGVLDKPYHYFMVGLFLVVWKYFLGSEMDLYFWGGIFIVISLASLLEKLITFLSQKYNYYQQNKKAKKQKEDLKNYYINEYKSLNKTEKYIIDFCLSNSTTSYEKPIFSDDEYILAIYSLINKGFGKNITYGGNFMMNKYCYDILRECLILQSRKL